MIVNANVAWRKRENKLIDWPFGGAHVEVEERSEVAVGEVVDVG